ncbi:hypothetical protein M3Y99_01145000 [Aphelenchoides fujianensis]|nr:hypothetical protein M3Y99_01145000 [Aphelenchoides fujianensis]
MPEENLESDYYSCACSVHVQTGALIFFGLSFFAALVNIARGIYNQDDFCTIGFFLDCAVILLAVASNRLRYRTGYTPFFVFHGSLMFGAAVLAVLRFHEVYERRGSAARVLLPNQAPRENLAPELIVYVLIVLVHAYMLRVVHKSYVFMGVASSQKKTNITALRVLIEAERERMLAIRGQNPDQTTTSAFLQIPPQ